MISIEHDSRISCEPSEIRHIECYVVIVEPIKVSQVLGVGGYSLQWPIPGGSARKGCLFKASGI